jgi:spore coat protein A, manganese oxidase
MALSRRQFVKLGVLGGAAALPLGAAARAASAGQVPAGPVIPSFARDLTIPPVLQPVRRDATTDYYRMTQEEAQVEILPGLKTTIWGYNGSFPGPTIMARRGRQAVVTVTNKLPLLGDTKAAYVCGDMATMPMPGLPALTPAQKAGATVTHLHGGVTPPGSDGYTTDLVPVGTSRDYTYPNDQRAATLWYHDHAMDTTAYHNYMGLSGMYIIHDAEEEALPLPKGEYDVPLILRDRTFNADGSFVLPHGQFFDDGDVTLVNGTAWPRFAVANRKYRFRILNASNSRPYMLTLGPDQPLVQIATDGGLLPAPVPSASIPLSPAERIEVVVDFATYPLGSQVILQNIGKDGQMGQIMRFDVVRSAVDDSSIPATLTTIEPLQPEQAVRERSFVFGPTLSRAHLPYVWTIDGQPFDSGRIDATPKLGDVEIWHFVNHKLGGIHGMPHPIHVHLINFQLLDRKGVKPLAYEMGWKDTVNVPEGEEVRVIMRFEGYQGKYMLHCHNLQHEDCAMMTNFETI